MVIQIENGTIVNAEKEFVDNLWVEDGKIVAIGTYSKTADYTINAEEKYIMPGGVDPHVHMYLPTPAGFSSDHFDTGSIAALYGGTTTIIDFVTPQPGQSLVKALDERLKEAQKSHIDYSFHVSPIEWRETTEQEIKTCIERGITSFKIYMAYKKAVGLEDDEIENVLRAVGKYGGLVTVHAEMGDEIDAMRDNAASAGKLDPAAHAQTRPNFTEADAVKKVIDMAQETNCPLYVVHVSTKEAVEHIENAQKKGQKVWGETCPHYLLLDESRYQGSFAETAKFVMSPPLRKAEDNEALWAALKKETISTVGTDHCPFMLEQKKVGKNDFRKIPNGAGSVEHRIPLLLTYGLAVRNLSLPEIISMVCAEPAKIFGLYPQKGALEIGSDADLFVWDPQKKERISAKTHHQNSDLNIYEGFETRGQVEWVIKNGQIVIGNGKIQHSVPLGKFLKRSLNHIVDW